MYKFEYFFIKLGLNNRFKDNILNNLEFILYLDVCIINQNILKYESFLKKIFNYKIVVVIDEF